MEKKIQRIFSSKASKGSLVSTVEDLDIPTQRVSMCEHDLICDSQKRFSMKCIYNQKECYIKKFYDKYPNYKEMFVGSKI